MPDLDTLRDLLTKVKATNEPSLEIDLQVQRYFYGNNAFEPASYTGDSDSVIGLAERHLPAIKAFAPGSPSSSGWRLTLYRGLTPSTESYGHWEANFRKHAQDGHTVTAKTPPLALLGALLTALIAEGGRADA